jgi:hypothetical protein
MTQSRALVKPGADVRKWGNEGSVVTLRFEAMFEGARLILAHKESAKPAVFLLRPNGPVNWCFKPPSKDCARNWLASSRTHSCSDFSV